MAEGVSFRVSHVSAGECFISFLVSAPGNSTYGRISATHTVRVTALGPGFLTSASQAALSSASPSVSVSIAPDTLPNSRVVLSVVASQPGLVSVFPSELSFSEGETTAKSLTLTWVAAGEVTLDFLASGGNYQNVERRGALRVTCLPSIPAPPATVSAAASLVAMSANTDSDHGHSAPPRGMVVSWMPPATAADLITAYIVQVSLDRNFHPISATVETPAANRSTTIALLVKGACYFYRVSARNAGGVGTPRPGADCVRVVEAPSTVSNLTVGALSDTQVLAEWRPPMDSGDGTAAGAMFCMPCCHVCAHLCLMRSACWSVFVDSYALFS
jgi:hypothetical protein